MELPIEISGIVQKGRERGREIGFPTVNIPLTKDIPEGIYIAETVIDGKMYPSAAFVGAAIHFGDDERKLESYVLDVNTDMYGKVITIRLLQKIRDSKKFDSDELLKAEMESDVAAVRAYFLSHKQ